MKIFVRLSPLLVVLCLVGSAIGCGSSSGTTSTNPAPTAPAVSSLSPSSAPAGGAGITLTVTGSNFVTGSEITWGGAKRATSYISSTSLQTDLSVADLASAATVQVAVANPQDAGGAVSGNLPFTIAANTAPNPVPVLNSITPNSVVVGSPDTTVTLNGSNFIASSTVSLASGTTLASAYQSATSLSVVIPASALATAGSLAISVANPAPGGGTSSPINFITTNRVTGGQSVISVRANDLAWDAINQVIYLSLPSAAGSNGNSIQVLNPSTGALGKSVLAGSEPDLLGVSKSSQYLYAALDGSAAVQRFTLPDLTSDINIPLGTSSSEGPYYAMDIQPSPAADGTFAVVRGTREQIPHEVGGVLIFDDAVQRPNQLCGFAEPDCTSGNGYANLYDSIQWSPAADEIYMLDNEDDNFSFYTSPLTANGFGAVTEYGGGPGGVNGYITRIHYDATTKLLYRDDGVVIDPATGAQAGSVNAPGWAAPDGAAGLIFYLVQTYKYPSTSYTIKSFDINNLTPISSLEIDNVVGTPLRLIRWGTNGLAFATSQGAFSTSQGAVYLVSGSFVTTSDRPAGSVPSAVYHTWQLPDRDAYDPKASDGKLE